MKALVLPSVAAIEACETIPEIVHVASVADATLRYIKRARRALEELNEAALLKLRAERRAGQLLAALGRARGGRAGNPISEYREALDTANLEPRAARRWQRIAELTDADFNRIVAETIGAGIELTTDRILTAMRVRKAPPRPGKHVTPGGTPVYADRWVTLYCGDSVTLLPTLHGCPDHVITDPPYRRHCGANQPGRMGRLDDGAPRVRELGFDELSPELIDAIAPQIARARRWSLVFSDVESTPDWRQALTTAGCRYVRTGAWVRQRTAPQFSGDRPAVGFEAVTICHNAAMRQMSWNGGGHAAIWDYPVARFDDAGRPHPTAKPLALMVELVEQFTVRRDCIWDPFAGSGTTLVAARQLERRAVGIERSPEFCQIAIDRLKKAGDIGA